MFHIAAKSSKSTAECQQVLLEDEHTKPSMMFATWFPSRNLVEDEICARAVRPKPPLAQLKLEIFHSSSTCAAE